jgi:LPXTG-motif cell wall-anchored protein
MEIPPPNRMRRLIALVLGAAVIVGLGAAFTGVASPPAFSNNGNVTAISAGAQQTCAIESGVVWCWGRAMVGSLGDGGDVTEQYNVFTPGRVVPTASFTNDGTVSAVVSGSTHGCAIEGGVLHCWGDNSGGRLGNGTFVNSSSPVQVLNHDGEGFSNTGVTDVSAGVAHTCAVQAGTVFCWGRNDGRGILGINDLNSVSNLALKVTRPQGLFLNNGSVSAVSAGSVHTCVIDDGRAFCWGGNRSSGSPNIGGHLGSGDLLDKRVATQVVAANGFVNNGTVSAVAVGTSTGNAESHTCAIEDGVLYCWGVNTEGQLALSPITVTQSAVPIKVPAANGFTNTAVTDVSLGREFTCAVENNKVFCWGINNFGQLGDGLAINSMNRFAEPRPVAVSASGFSNTNVTSVEAGMYHACAIEAGTSYCWGMNSFGRLGNSNETDSSTPVKVGTGAAQATPSVTSPIATATWTVGTPVNLQFAVADFSAAPTFAVIAGTLPPGLDLNTATGLISGTPSSPSASSQITVEAVAGGQSATVQITISVEADQSSSSTTPGPTASEPSAENTSTPAPRQITGPRVIPLPPADVVSRLIPTDSSNLRQAPGTVGIHRGAHSTQLPTTPIAASQSDPGTGAAWEATSSGTILRGALRNPLNPELLIDIAASDVVTILNEEVQVVIVGLNPDLQPAPIVDGVLQLQTGGALAAHINGITPESSGELVLMSSPHLLGAFVTSIDGEFSGQFSLPTSVETGAHTLVLALDGFTISLGVNIHGDVPEAAPTPENQLPATGPTPISLLIALTAALILGFGLIVRRRALI